MDLALIGLIYLLKWWNIEILLKLILCSLKLPTKLTYELDSRVWTTRMLYKTNATPVIQHNFYQDAFPGNFPQVLEISCGTTSEWLFHIPFSVTPFWNKLKDAQLNLGMTNLVFPNKHFLFNKKIKRRIRVTKEMAIYCFHQERIQSPVGALMELLRK